MDKHLHTGFKFFNCNLRSYCCFVFLGVACINNAVLYFILEKFVSDYFSYHLTGFHYLIINFFGSVINFLILTIYFKEVRFYLDNDFVWSTSDEVKNLIFLIFFNVLMVLSGGITVSLLQ
ncbi:MAG TPA: hypothetical protein DC020_09470 [Flavobacterium sp.]|nr:MAG: hypothetical protein A2X07_06260 [Flavobacteria bacterium GWF1_32_7]HBD27032.1 hypothetical protein [Flavobacterium sp.]